MSAEHQVVVAGQIARDLVPQVSEMPAAASPAAAASVPTPVLVSPGDPAPGRQPPTRPAGPDLPKELRDF